MLISFSKKFIFVHNFKVAGTSIQRALNKYQPLYINLFKKSPGFHKKFGSKLIKSIPDGFKNDRIVSLQFQAHTTSQEIKESLSEETFNEFYKFGFVRNPWDWLISNYFYGLKHPKAPDHKLLKNSKNFDEIVEYTVNNNGPCQKSFFYDENGNQLVNFIGKFENINEDFQYITEQIGLKDVKLPHTNKTQHKNYREYYNDHTRKLVEEYFKADIELFGYEF